MAQWVSATVLPETGALAGFIDDRADALAGRDLEVPLLSGITTHSPQPDQLHVMAIADPKAKLAVGSSLLQRGARFLTFIHPRALIGSRVTIGVGAVFCPNAVVSSDARIGDFVTVNLGCTVGHDTELGDGCTLSCQVDIAGWAKIGKGAFFGSHATVLPRATVGDFAKVGACSAVLRSVDEGTTVFGVPARRVA
ncbi:MAG: acetyltransferase [Candidatus Wallbacteria bacterium]|nr:acetyltransferase [Candidatus Wallbacteria bacterium]